MNERLVVVASPPATHVPLALAAIEAGIASLRQEQAADPEAILALLGPAIGNIFSNIVNSL